MNRKLLCLDYDNTLYSHFTQRIPQSAHEALKAFVCQGNHLVIATGRGPESIPIIRQNLQVSCDEIICLNGQMLFRGEQLVHTAFMEMPSLQKIIAICKQQNFAYGGYYAQGEAVSQMNEAVKRVWTDFDSCMPTIVPQIGVNPKLYQGRLYITKDQLPLFEGCLNDYLINFSHPSMMNLISKSSGKSAKIKEIIHAENIALADTYAIGDGFNDVDMLQCVGCGIAMGNASSVLKEVADYVTAHIDEDGLCKALQYYGLI